ncbi:hypothetical protein [Kitasatospora sp. NPDC088783]|uniref:hypothetical protein n=1 Tax=Kitasatospora sp. NPDC088783 TaxID=3364077 RepID=UPI003818C5CE
MATDYDAARRTVAEALALIDENPDFDTARDEDPQWPADLERDAVLAVRALRDGFSSRIRNTPAPADATR